MGSRHEFTIVGGNDNTGKNVGGNHDEKQTVRLNVDCGGFGHCQHHDVEELLKFVKEFAFSIGQEGRTHFLRRLVL